MPSKLLSIFRKKIASWKGSVINVLAARCILCCVAVFGLHFSYKLSVTRKSTHWILRLRMYSVQSCWNRSTTINGWRRQCSPRFSAIHRFCAPHTNFTAACAPHNFSNIFKTMNNTRPQYILLCFPAVQTTKRKTFFTRVGFANICFNQKHQVIKIPKQTSFNTAKPPPCSNACKEHSPSKVWWPTPWI